MKIKTFSLHNLIKNNESAEEINMSNLTKILSKNYAKNFIVLILSKDYNSFIDLIFEYLDDQNNHTNISLFSDQADFLSNYQAKKYKNIVFKSLIAYQNFFDINFSENPEIDFLPLGRIHENIFSAEPYFRNSDMTLIDFNSVKKSDFPGKCNFSPIGLNAEETCSMSYFMGNGQNKMVVLYNYDSDADDTSKKISNVLIENLIHYMEKGISNRDSANLVNENNLVYYNIQSNSNDYEFVKNTLSNKWWVLNSEKEWIPCSYEDYTEIVENENLSDYLLKNI